MDSSSEPVWDCRWPDPVALRVSAERILRGLPMDDPGINRRLTITVNPESDDNPAGVASALLVTPWAVERVWWHSASRGEVPPIRHAFVLDADGAGRVAAGQGVLLDLGENRLVPVVVAWEPETGHYFVETLLHHTEGFDSAPEALAVALGAPPSPSPRLSITATFNKAVSRRGLLGFWRHGAS
ncbi:MAG: hypothetical protein HQL96_04970 [Magnetococcales bacterium]|nr:hypothetical protein [Magnetococcales bacterium]